MGRLTYTTEVMSLHYALETSTFGSTDNINELCSVEQLYAYGITQIQLCLKFFELGQVFLGSYSSFLKVTHQSLSGTLLLCILETKLNGCITIFLYCLHLSNYTRTCFDNSAWYIFTIGTENGCHSDFLS